MMMRKTAIVCMMLAFFNTLSVQGAITRYVNDPDGLNVRDSCSINDDILEVLDYGTAVIQEETIGIGSVVWAHITHGVAKGYVVADYLSDEDPLKDREYMGEWRVTAYAYTGYPCASGKYPEAEHTVACNSLPFGVHVYIDGVGERVVEDRGPSDMGDQWLDLYLVDYDTCMQWGDQYRRVWVMK